MVYTFCVGFDIAYSRMVGNARASVDGISRCADSHAFSICFFSGILMAFGNQFFCEVIMYSSTDVLLREKYNKVVEKHKYPIRGLFVPSDNPCSKVLFVGYNPSLGKTPQNNDYPKFSDICENEFWKPVKELAKDIIDDVAFLDMFPVRSSNQHELESEKYNSLRSELLEITQQEIEEHIKPKLIVMLNRSASYYWGIKKNALWMGYDFQNTSFGDIRGNKVLRIRGFKESSFGNTRINIDKFSDENSSLVSSKTHVLFYRQLKTNRKQYSAESIITSKELYYLWADIKSMTNK